MLGLWFWLCLVVYVWVLCFVMCVVLYVVCMGCCVLDVYLLVVLLGFCGVGFITPVGRNQIGSLFLREGDCANVVIEAQEPPVALVLDMDALYISGPFQQGESRLDFCLRKVQRFGEALDIQLPLLSQAENLHIDTKRQRINIAVEDDALAYLLVVFGGFDYAYITSHC